jgi:hypothetical protein
MHGFRIICPASPWLPPPQIIPIQAISGSSHPAAELTVAAGRRRQLRQTDGGGGLLAAAAAGGGGRSKFPGATVNDVFAALMTMTVRKYLEERGDPAAAGGTRVRAAFTVNARPEARSLPDRSPLPLGPTLRHLFVRSV